MPNTSAPRSAADFDLGLNDLGPLAWVLEELRKSLDTSTKALKRFVRDAEAIRGSDLAALDASQLRIARGQLHQAVGALEMVGLGAPALMLHAMESAAQKFVQRPDLCSAEAALQVERASFALIEYLENVLAGKSVSSVSLFAQYREVQTLAGAERVHPADLWAHEWRWQEVAIAPEHLVALPIGGAPVTRAQMDPLLLRIVKSLDPKAATELETLALRLRHSASQDKKARTFWAIAAAYFEALAQRRLPADMYVKRAASRLLLQFTALEKDDKEISDRLAHDLLFFCAQAGEDVGTPLLRAVRQAYRLGAYKAVHYDHSTFGRFDPALLAQARKRVQSVKETWSQVAGGDTNRIKAVSDQFSLVSESLVKLHPASEPLALALNQTMEAMLRSGKAPATDVSMEVATSALYLEAVFEDLDPNDPHLAQRTTRLAQRLQSVLAGGKPEALEPWMEELYRRVSDKQTMGSVVDELRVNLGELEQSLDQFFRNPVEKGGLQRVPSQLAQMRGVLSVLGLDQASLAMVRMRDTVEGLMGDSAQDLTEQSEKLGNSLGALGFLIDMLGYQPALAKKLFVFDEAMGELRPVMGRTHEQPFAPEAVEDELPRADFVDSLTQSLSSLVQQVQASPDATTDPRLSSQFDQLATHAVLADQPRLASAARDAAAAVAAQDAHATTQALQVLASAVVPEPAPAVAPAASADIPSAAQDIDDELLGIFLEEAREVVQNGQAAVQALVASPADVGEQTTLRRAFHTLKGSSRMVGLNEFGEAAWGMEQVLNAWLSEAKPASVELQTLSATTLTALAQWVEDIAAKQDGAWRAAGFRASADALREQNVYVPLVVAGVSAASTSVAAIATEAAPPDASNSATTLTVATDEVAFVEFGASPGTLELAASHAPPAPTTNLVDIAGIDFASLEQVAATPSAASAAAPNSALAAGAAVDDISFDLELGSDASADEATVAHAAQVAEAGESRFDADEFDDAFLREVAALEEAMNTQQAALEASIPSAPHAATEFLGGAGFANTASAAMDEALRADQVTQFSDTVTADYHESQPSGLAPQEMQSLGLNDFDFAAPAALATAAAASLASQAAPAVADVPAVPVAVTPSPFDNSDQVKVIGPLRIGLALYNVYLNEADEWSRRLQTELGEWALEHHKALGDTPVALAHSLAGSSATVGFSALSELARALELAQLHVQTLGRGSARQAQVFCDCAEAIRSLLHQFAAGFLRKADAGLLEQLKAIQSDEAPPDPVPAEQLASDQPEESEDLQQAQALQEPQESSELQHFSAGEETQEPVAVQDASTAGEAVPHSEPADLEPLPEFKVSVSEISATEWQVAGDMAATASQDLASDRAVAGADIHSDAIENVASGDELALHAAKLEAAALAAAQPLAAVTRDFEASRFDALPSLDPVTDINPATDDEEIDAQDAVDPDLFPIFEEEAIELMPQLGSVMRQWQARPGNASARTEALRSLHTLKGSARLAGALRLGEMAHRMESAIEYLPSEGLTQDDIEPLVARFDALQNTLEQLRQHDAQGYAQAVAASAAQAEQALEQAVDAEPPAAEHLVEADPSPSLGAVAVPAPARAPLQVSAAALSMPALRSAAHQTVRVRSQLLDRMVNQAGEVIITRTRLEAEMSQLRGSLTDLTGNLDRLRLQLRDIEVQAESQMQSRLAQTKEDAAFDPLEFDRFTRVQELTRMMAESVNDVATVQRNLQRTLESTEDELIAQARQTRDLQRDLLRTRMVEFEGISERLYRVVRQASKDANKQVKLDIEGGAIEMDRGVLDRMTPAFEHLLRNCVAHGIEAAEQRRLAGKDETGTIVIALHHEGNDVSVEFRDDGAGLNIARIRDKAIAQGLLTNEQTVDDNTAADLIFTPGFSTAAQVTELSGRGVGMDVVRSEVSAVGGRIETRTSTGQGTSFKLVLPLTTAVTQVVMLRAGKLSIGVPANVVEMVRRASAKELQAAYNAGTIEFASESIPFFWSGALLQSSSRSNEHQGKTIPVVVFRSAGQRVAMHVDEVLGSREVVVKNLGPQLSRLPGLAGMSVLASGAVVLIYNPVALAAIYGEQARLLSADHAEPQVLEAATDARGSVSVPQLAGPASAPLAPLVLVVDDSITVRRVTQRLLQREGYRVAMAADGLQAIERLAEERPAVVLSDIEMPRMDGFDLARNIRGDSKLANLPIVMITSRIAEKHREHAMELGVNHYLGKPYSEEELLSLVRRYTAAEAVV
jgi:chemosensory pili system protein ChpA (sensor histidine kinase/response regulator)